MTKGRVGIIYFGISYSLGTDGAVRQRRRVHTDYRQNLQNHKDSFFKFFDGYDIDIFLSTNKSKLEHNLRIDFDPIDITYPKTNNSNLISRNSKVIAGINSLLCHADTHKIKYDYILITRFDIFFLDSWENVNIDLTKMNLVSILEKQNLICDNLYIFPYEYLKGFLKIIISGNGHKSHTIKGKLEKLAPINYIKNEHVSVKHLSFYRLTRSRRAPSYAKIGPNARKEIKKKNLLAKQKANALAEKKAEMIAEKEAVILARQSNQAISSDTSYVDMLAKTDIIQKNEDIMACKNEIEDSSVPTIRDNVIVHPISNPKSKSKKRKIGPRERMKRKQAYYLSLRL